ncbi:hypothetical protein P3L10_027836 [Capsicum annuum]
MAMTIALSPLQYLSMHIDNTGQNGRRNIQVSCGSSNKWAVQEDLKSTSSYNQDGFSSTKFERLVKEVKYALRSESNDNLAFVGALQRMGIEYHFQEEIDQFYKRSILLRQEGYHVSADVFKKFKNNDDGTFGLNLSQDVSGLTGLYEAAQLGVEGEHILDEVANFSGHHLNACLANNDSYVQARLIKETLKYPYHEFSKFQGQKLHQ